MPIIARGRISSTDIPLVGSLFPACSSTFPRERRRAPPVDGPSLFSTVCLSQAPAIEVELLQSKLCSLQPSPCHKTPPGWNSFQGELVLPDFGSGSEDQRSETPQRQAIEGLSRL